MTAMIEFKNVDIIFGKTPQEAIRRLDQGQDRTTILEATGNTVGVHNASIKVKEGEICVLMGLSGSGKSTLLRSANGLNKPTRGQVIIKDGDQLVDVASCDEDTLRRLRMERISMVFQHFGLLPWRTVESNVGLGLELKGVPRSERKARVEEKLKLVHLTEWKDKFVHELSGGMQQRVGLARAFATDADVLLMDEPFSALDPLIRHHLQDELLELQSTLHKTIIFVSHDLDEAVKLGTHIAIMKDGVIVQYGTPEEIILYPANQYVADFVSHLNPLNALTGKVLMNPLDAIRRRGKELWLDYWGRYRLTLDKNNVPQKVMIDGKAGQFLNYEPGLKYQTERSDVILLGSQEMIMREIIEFRWELGTPVLIVEDGKLLGVVGDDEIYWSILGKGVKVPPAQALAAP
ncbi:MAG: choline ABC transporter ATP-binding protein [SAR324 cluster bacterium]|uniref:Choline ABC transporter ATP-binding protein n=1 Tax=SAR324 cluster bacterium TaxID=2024889 RepID=A0A2A4T907_9DELT|nr:MAG: choline ABC transporter ATP-binding protein [SAR324 cluster bacterium]